MRILTLFLALFLTLLPENAHYVPYSQGQDVCLEEVNDVEEEAVIRTERRAQEQDQTSLLPVSGDSSGVLYAYLNPLFHIAVLKGSGYAAAGYGFRRGPSVWRTYCLLSKLIIWI